MSKKFLTLKEIEEEHPERGCLKFARSSYLRQEAIKRVKAGNNKLDKFCNITSKDLKNGWKCKNYVKKELVKSHIKYGCGHETNGVIILDENLLSMSAYIGWAEEENNLETKEECFDCYLKKLSSKS